MGEEDVLSIGVLEKPKGCMSVFAALKEKQPICVSEIMRYSNLGQKAVYSSLERLMQLGIARKLHGKTIKGKANPVSLTDWGCRLGNFVLILIDDLRKSTGRYRIDPYLTMPSGCLRILVHNNWEGSSTPGEIVSKLALCSGTANSALKELRRLGLVYSRRMKRFRKARKVYKLTKAGRCLAYYLDAIDEALEWKND